MVVSTTGELYVVATPIGHRKDITFRAIEVLQQVDWIAAEDTRHSGALLAHYAIDTPMISLHQHNEQQRANDLIKKLQAGQSVALISDAGTPLVSDPGARLVASVVAQGLTCVPVPGACAGVAALSASGLKFDQFVFMGFLPSKGAKRQQAIVALAAEPRAIILYESVHRVMSLLTGLADCLPHDRTVVVAREITKRYETFVRGSAQSVLATIQQHPDACRGEFVVMIDQATINDDVQRQQQQEALLRVCLAECSPKVATQLVMTLTGGKRNAIYALAMSLKEEGIKDE